MTDPNRQYSSQVFTFEESIHVYFRRSTFLKILIFRCKLRVFFFSFLYVFSSLDMFLVSSPSKAYTPTAVIVDVKKPCYMYSATSEVSSAYSKLNTSPCESKQIHFAKASKTAVAEGRR